MTPAELLEQHQETAKKRRAAWRIVTILLISGVVVVALLPMVVYFAWRARGRSLLQAELRRIEAAGEPLTTAEMAEHYALRSDMKDNTQQWTTALAPFDDAFLSATIAVPFVGDKEPLPPLSQALTNEQAAAIDSYLQEFGKHHTAVYAAADSQGEVRFPREFRKGTEFLLPETEQARTATRSLHLEFQHLVRSSNVPAAIRNLEVRNRLCNVFEREPVLVTLLVRVWLTSLNLTDLRQLAETQRLHDEQLKSLQQLVRSMDLHRQLPEVVIGERAMTYHFFSQKLGLVPDVDSMTPKPRDTVKSVDTIERPEDCAMALALLADRHSAAQLPLVESIKAFDDASLRLHRLGPEANTLTRFRFSVTSKLLPVVDLAIIAEARAAVFIAATDTVLAIRRYQLKYGKLPTSLDKLVPEFLSPPIDPYDGQPLKYVVEGEHARVYSIGFDRRDDQGVMDPKTFGPDIAVVFRVSPP